MGIEPITSVLQTDASPSRPQTARLLCPSHQHFVNLVREASFHGANEFSFRFAALSS